MSQITKCPNVTVVLTYWEASVEISELSYKSLLYSISVGSYCTKSESSIWAPWGPKNGRNGPFRAGSGKNRIDGCVRTEISVV